MSRTRAKLAVGLAAVAALAVGAITTMPSAEAVPSPTNATLTVKKSGDRIGSQATAPTGTCSVDVPGRTGNNQGYWIRERTAPAPFSIVDTLDVGVGNGTVATPYNRIFTGNVQNNQAYAFPVAGTGQSLTSRSDFWADIRDNPDLPGDCGLSIALLIDVSGSITPFLPQVKTAANGFVDALTGTPSQIAVYSFAENANAVLASTAVSDATGANTVKTAINGLTSGGTANWDAGLFQIATSPSAYDAVIMLTLASGLGLLFAVRRRWRTESEEQ